jgi:thioredoxin reductase (NADPH)
LDEVLDSPSLSPAQFATLRGIGAERQAEPGELLYAVGDRDFPFVAIVEGEVAVRDAAGREIARHGPSNFLGEMNLLSGQSLLVSAVAETPLRYIAVERGRCATCSSTTRPSATCC